MGYLVYSRPKQEREIAVNEALRLVALAPQPSEREATKIAKLSEHTVRMPCATVC